MLPKRKPRARSGIKRAVEREWPKHDRFIRSRECVLAHVPEHICSSPTRACHWRSAANSGMKIKPHSWFLWPGCDAAHAEQHNIGQPAFERKYGINLTETALGLACISPDHEMRKALKESSHV